MIRRYFATFPGSKSRGFTLVELIVAIGITAVLAGLLLFLVNSTSSVWQRTVDPLSLESDARLILDRMETDFSSMFSRRDGREWLRAAAADSTIIWQCFASVAATSGDDTDPNTIREIVYVFENDGALGRLQRWEGTAATALNNGYAFEGPGDLSTGEFLLGEKVTGLTIQSFGASNTLELATVSADSWPALMRVELSLVSEDGANRLQAIAAGASGETIEQVKAETERTYVRWIAVEGRPL